MRFFRRRWPPWAVHLSNQAEKLMIKTDDLVAVAKRLQKDNTDLLAQFKESRDNAASLATQLQAALDQLKAIPTDTSAQEAIIAGVVADLTTIATTTEATIASNPAVPDLGPAPAPAPAPDVPDPTKVQV